MYMLIDSIFSVHRVWLGLVFRLLVSLLNPFSYSTVVRVNRELLAPLAVVALTRPDPR